MSSHKTQKPDDVGGRTPAAERRNAAESDGLTDPETVKELIAEQERTQRSETSTDATPRPRQYACLDCGTVVDGFPGQCPDCESSSFETAPAHEGSNLETPAEELFDAYAEFTAPYNPYIPR